MGQRKGLINFQKVEPIFFSTFGEVMDVDGFTMRKWTDLQLALQLGFRVAMTICNSLQLNIFLQV
jgi:hypothetical protein